MIIPIGDEDRRPHVKPVVTWLLIAANVIVIVFVFGQNFGTNVRLTNALAAVPAQIVQGQDITTEGTTIRHPRTGEQIQLPGLPPTPVPVWLTLITSMFLHGHLLHLIFNMLFLSVFGDTLEKELGRSWFLLFYLASGVAAMLLHVLTSVVLDTALLAPSIGASGAISAILGAYIVLFPGRRVAVLFFWLPMAFPAYVTIGVWIALQVTSGLMALMTPGTPPVAYAAHIGGFAVGLAFARLYRLHGSRA